MGMSKWLAALGLFTPACAPSGTAHVKQAGGGGGIGGSATSTATGTGTSTSTASKTGTSTNSGTNGPAIPIGVAAVGGDGQVTISWDEVPSATSYAVYWSVTPGVTDSQILPATKPPLVQSNLPPGMEYYYAVTAKNSLGESAMSAETSATTFAIGPVPSDFAAEPHVGRNVLTWTAAVGQTYDLLFGATSTILPSSSRVSGIQPGYVHLSLTADVPVFYKLEVATVGKAKALTTVVAATPLALPAAPTGLTLVPSDQQVTVSWNAVGGATSYNIYWKATTGVTVNDQKLANVTSPFVHGSLANGSTYFYAVAALNLDDMGPLSAQASASPFLVCHPEISNTLELSNIPAATGTVVATARFYGSATSTNLVAVHLSSFDQSSATNVKAVAICRTSGKFMALCALTDADVNGAALRPLIFDNLSIGADANLVLVVLKSDDSMTKQTVPVAYFSVYSGQAVVDLSAHTVDAGFVGRQSVTEFNATGAVADTGVTYPNTYDSGATRNLMTAQAATTWTKGAGVQGTVTDVMGNTLSTMDLSEHQCICTYVAGAGVYYRTMLRIG